MLEVRALSYTPDQSPLLQGINFCLNQGRTLHVQGVNGTGKTSLMRLIAGLIPCEQGEVLWHGRRIKQAADYQGQLTYVGHQTGCFMPLSLRHNLSWHYRLMFAAASSDKKKHSALLDTALDFAGIKTRQDMLFYRLSAGQKQRLHLARLWLSVHHAMHHLWLLDEPLAHVDQRTKASYFELFAAFKQQQGILVIASHQDQQEIAADYHIVLS